MFQDVDETLRAVLIADVPIKKNEIDIAFDRPTRDWSSRLTRPSLNLFLADIRERVDLKDDVPIITRDETGKAVRQRPPKRMDLAYLVSAWTTEPDDEHRILARVLASMYRQAGTIAAELLQGELKIATLPVMARVPEPEQSLKGQDLWGALGNDLHASLTWTWTVPLEAFKPTVGPLVRTAEIRIGPSGQSPDVALVQVGGLVHRKGDRTAGVAGARIQVLGTAFEAVSDADGEFSFRNLPTGDYKWRVEPPDGKARDHKVVVPAAAYDIEV